MNSTRDMAKEVTDWAKEINNIRGVLLTSNRANPNATLDVLTDYNIEVFVEDFQPFLKGYQWLEAFGDILVCSPYKPALDEKGNILWCHVIFKDGPEIHLAIQLVKEMENYVQDATLDPSLDIGYKILLDKDGKLEGLAPPTYTAYRTKPPTEFEYQDLINNFWWSITYVAKNLFRDQLFFAKYQLDGALHHKHLYTTLSWHIGMKNNWKSDPGRQGKWLKRYLDAETWTEIEATFAGAGLEENWKAMFKTAEMFGRLASEVGAHLGYDYPFKLDQDLTGYLTKVKSLTAEQSTQE